MTNNTHLITVTGPSLSGKTEFTKILEDLGNFHVITSVTTRPKRQHEIDGIDYHFVTEKKFKSMPMIQTTYFNGFNYGVSEEEVDKKSSKPILWVIAPQSIKQVEDFAKKRNWIFTKVFVSNPQEVLIERFLERLKNDTLADIKNYTKRLNNIITNEINWTHEAKEGVIGYDFKVFEFNANNTQKVITDFYKYIQENNPSPLRQKIKFTC